MPAHRSERWKKLKSDWYILLIALVLSFFVWVLYDMSLGYDTYVQYSVEVTSALAGYDEKSVSNELLVLQGKGDGYYVLLKKLRRNKVDKVRIEVDPSFFHPVEGVPDRFFVWTEDIEMEVAQALSDKFEPAFFDTRQLTFDFAPRSFKTVPVDIKSNVSCKSQYMLTSDVKVSPDSVRIYGRTEDLQFIDAVQTKFLSLSGVDRSGSGSIELEPLRGVRIENKRVNYSFTVARYVEKAELVDVGVTNAPRGRELLVLPSKVTVVYRTAFTGVDDGFVPQVAVDYNDYAESRSGKVIPRLVNENDDIFSYTISPLPLECIMTDR
ncbi:MAG: YbbR-like domain-containing protein [Bacteroidales bacterium]|nr:YbbR-like domain-containing protein [Bacteroidales bacterium]